MGDDFIPVNVPLFGETEKRYLAECVDTGWISSEGPFVKRLEQGMARTSDRAFGVAVSSGTAALDTAFAALDIGPGDEVVLPSFTIISCVHQIVRSGATPVFADCRADTWCMNAETVEPCLTDRTRAVLAVHIYGLPVDMDPLVKLCQERGLTLVEDAAQAIGLSCAGRPCGSFGLMSIMSFYPNKTITTGEGGMVLTNDENLAERCRSLRNLCFQPGQRFLHEELGWNYRMSNLQAAVGVAQMERMDETCTRKRAIGLRYADAWQGHPRISMAPQSVPWAENQYWAVGALLSGADGEPLDAGPVMAELGRRGVGSRPFFHPLHTQPVLAPHLAAHQPPCPEAERIAACGLYLPSGAGLTDGQADRAASALLDVMETL